MGILGYKLIKLYKIKTAIGTRSEEYEADLTDEKMKEIATALGCDLQIMTSGSKWLLYKGTNTNNGWLCRIKDGYFEVRRYLNGQEVNPGSLVNTNYLQCRISITNQSALKSLVVHYSKGKNGAVLFKFGNTSDDVLLNYCICEASVIGTDKKISVYGFIDSPNYYFTTSDSTTITCTISNVYGYADNLILMSAIALKDKNAIIDGMYRCDICKNQSTHYIFDLAGKKYMASDGGTDSKWAIELDDSMLE